MLIQKEQENTSCMEKHNRKDKQIADQLILSDTLKFNNSSINFKNYSASTLGSPFRRKKSLVSLYHNKTPSNEKINKTPSPKNTTHAPFCLNSKEKNINLKQNLLNQKFHQLSINQTQKKPLKLKLSKINSQNTNNLIKQQIHHFSEGLENRFENQNKMIKHQLQKIQNLITQNSHLPYIRPRTSSGKDKNLSISSKQQILILQQTNIKRKQENESKIRQGNQSKILELMQQNQKLRVELNQVKTINNFLLAQNYKLSVEIQHLKQRVAKYDQKQSTNLTENSIMNEQQSEQIQKVHSGQQFLGSTSCETMTKTSSQTVAKQCFEQRKDYFEQKKSIFQQRKKSKFKTQYISKKDILISQIETEGFSLQNKNVEQEQSTSSVKLKEEIQQIQPNLPSNPVQEHIIAELKEKIQTLQQQIIEQKDRNDQLANQMAALKLQNHGIITLYNQAKQNHPSDTLLSIQIYSQESGEETHKSLLASKKSKEQHQQKIQNQQHTDENESNSSMLNQTPQFNQPQKTFPISQLSLQNIPHTDSKSKIPFNQIPFFLQTIINQKQPNNSINPQKDQQQQQKSRKIPQKSLSILSTIHQVDQFDRGKSLGIEKKLKIPVEEMGKMRRKSIVQNLSLSLQKKQKGKNKNNSLNFYSKQKVTQMQIIRQTISLKFQAFKYTYEMFQNQMILHPRKRATLQQLKTILSQYPFLLQGGSIDLLLGYCDVQNSTGVQVDHFSNKLRQFISDYYQRTEQQEMVIEKKILKRWKYTRNQILEAMKRSQSEDGEIRKENFVTVLDQFKFEKSEIHHLLSQSVAISPDINHIKYRQYLDNFLSII